MKKRNLARLQAGIEGGVLICVVAGISFFATGNWKQMIVITVTSCGVMFLFRYCHGLLWSRLEQQDVDEKQYYITTKHLNE